MILAKRNVDTTVIALLRNNKALSCSEKAYNVAFLLHYSQL